jgi:hypothetical protein
VAKSPKLRPYLRGPRTTWSDIVDAADYLRGDLGVSKSLWAEACGIMNRYRAAVALAIVYRAVQIQATGRSKNRPPRRPLAENVRTKTLIQDKQLEPFGLWNHRCSEPAFCGGGVA